MKNLFRLISLLIIGSYRTIGTQHLGGCCRFTPSCSEFAMSCFHKFDFFQAFKLTFIRFLKCRPGGGFGFDPVPEIGEISGPK